MRRGCCCFFFDKDACHDKLTNVEESTRPLAKKENQAVRQDARKRLNKFRNIN